MDLNILAFGLMGTAVLISLKDIYETRPGAWLAGAERLLRGGKIDVAETGSRDEVEEWISKHDGVEVAGDDPERLNRILVAMEKSPFETGSPLDQIWSQVREDVEAALRTGRPVEEVQRGRHAQEKKELGL